MRIKTITELLGLIHERWQSLEFFCWEVQDEHGADHGSQTLKHIALGFLPILSHENKHQVKLKSSKLRMKSKCPDTCLITYGSCCYRRLLRQILWLEFEGNWTLFGLPYYKRLKTVTSVIESYTQGWMLIS